MKSQGEKTNTPSKSRGRPIKQGLREHLLEHTLKVLLRDGYKKFSMNAVASSANASKETLYRHFGDRSGLLTAAIEQHSSGVKDLLMNGINDSIDKQQLLTILAKNYIAGCELPEAIALQRIAYSDGKAGLGPLFAKKFTNTAVDIVAELFKKLGTPNPAIDAEVFLGMIQGKIHERTLLGLKKNHVQQQAVINKSVELFLIYLGDLDT